MADRQEHTAEPWTIDLRGGALVLRGKATEAVATLPRPETEGYGVVSGVERRANARRIVAAINACAGIETETLKEGPLVEVQDRAGVAEARTDAAEALLDECSQRLRKCIVAAGSDEKYADIAVADYRAFLAKAKP